MQQEEKSKKFPPIFLVQTQVLGLNRERMGEGKRYA
jgi:hypothetical protein